MLRSLPPLPKMLTGQMRVAPNGPTQPRPPHRTASPLPYTTLGRLKRTCAVTHGLLRCFACARVREGGASNGWASHLVPTPTTPVLHTSAPHRICRLLLQVPLAASTAVYKRNAAAWPHMPKVGSTCTTSCPPGMGDAVSCQPLLQAPAKGVMLCSRPTGRVAARDGQPPSLQASSSTANEQLGLRRRISEPQEHNCQAPGGSARRQLLEGPASTSKSKEHKRWLHEASLRNRQERSRYQRQQHQLLRECPSSFKKRGCAQTSGCRAATKGRGRAARTAVDVTQRESLARALEQPHQQHRRRAHSAFRSRTTPPQTADPNHWDHHS